MTRLLFILVVGLFNVAVAGDVSTAAEPTIWDSFHFPEDISENGHLIDWLFMYVTYAITFSFILVVMGLVGFSFFYYHKRHPKPYYTYGTTRTQIYVATFVGVAVFFCIDLNIVRISNNDFTKVFMNWPDEKKEKVVRVEVMGQQWMWKFRYAGADGVFNTGDDVITLNDLRVPTGTKVSFQITSKDVIHSFFIPNGRRKVDAIPGRITRMWMQFKKTGTWDIACAEMCGTHHYLMKASLTTMDEKDYNTWINQAQTYAVAENDVENPDVFWGWKWD